MTLKNRFVIRFAINTAKCCLCGHFRLTKSQYSIVRMIWLGSVSPNIASTPYIESSTGFFRRMSNRLPELVVRSLETPTISPSPIAVGSSQICSSSRASSRLSDEMDTVSEIGISTSVTLMAAMRRQGSRRIDGAVNLSPGTGANRSPALLLNQTLAAGILTPRALNSPDVWAGIKKGHPQNSEWPMFSLVGGGGFEPPTPGFSVLCSTN